ncbi:Interferon-induced GTP-binding protein [Sphaerulina musiva]
MSGDDDNAALSALQSAQSIKRLRQISSLRAGGISDKVNLPQLIVAGDQSAGKSSVLEGITGIPFPREEGVCTKFPTEVILEHTKDPITVSASIIPHSLRQGKERAALQAYSSSIATLEKLPTIIAEAGALMGLRGYGNNDQGPSFVEDVLQIKVTGPSGLHLSIVDLPGLISTPSEEQTEEDMNTVHRMVDSYLENPRTIVLAVVQASNDIANQGIIRKSKKFDRAGQRTVGIITKPDLINVGAEGRIAALAKNQDSTRLELGFFLLKNPTPREREDNVTQKQRSGNELRYFQCSPWKEQSLDPLRVGIDNLKTFIQDLLDQHIERELPKVRDDIKSIIRTTEEEIMALPPERSSTGHIRQYLSDIAMQYHSVAMAALNGEYHTGYASFFATDHTKIGSTRLRARIHIMNTGFSQTMRDRDQRLRVGKRKYVEPAIKSASSVHGLKKSKSKSRSELPESLANVSPVTHGQTPPQIVNHEQDSDTEEDCVTESEMRNWVKKIYQTTRGRELPGNCNHALLTELFHEQSKPWRNIATEHVANVHNSTVRFVNHVLAYLKIEEHVLVGIKEGIEVALQESKIKAEEELSKLWADEQEHPITYNHYYTDNVQKSRLDGTQKMLERALETANVISDDTPRSKSISNMSVDMLIAAVRSNVVVDMDEQACSEALDELKAYYKVALKTFVDNVCKQVVERHLLRNLPSMFSPRVVAMYTDEELEKIAGERPEIVRKRKQLREQLGNLRVWLELLRK